jgi:hypothetical protein
MSIHLTNVNMEKKQDEQLVRGGDSYTNRCNTSHSVIHLSVFGL